MQGMLVSMIAHRGGIASEYLSTLLQRDSIRDLFFQKSARWVTRH
jgi:hypothetical protein